MKNFIYLFLLFWSATAFSDCANWDSKELKNPRVQIKSAQDQPVHFLSEPKTCPSVGACTQSKKAYLLNGDTGYEISKEGDFSCVAYVGSNGKAVMGWIPASNLEKFVPWTIDPNKSAHPVKWSSQLHASSRSEIEKKFALQFSDSFEGTVNKNPAKISNCSQAIDMAKTFNAPNVDYKPFLGALADCRILKAIQSLKPAQTSFVDGFEFSSKSLSELPAGVDLLISNDSVSDAAQADKKGTPLSKFNPADRVKSVQPMSITFGDPDSTITLELIAQGDYDGDGIEDLVIKQTTSTSGTYGGSHVFVLTRKKASGVLQMVEPTFP